MQIIGPKWKGLLVSKLQRAEEEVFVAVPYISKFGVRIIHSTIDSSVKTRVLLGCSLEDIVRGMTDYDALLWLVEFAEVRHVHNLHAKVYIFDRNQSIVTSSNLTKRGIVSNLEFGVLIEDEETTKMLLEKLEPYWERGTSLSSDALPSRKAIKMETEKTQKPKRKYSGALRNLEELLNSTRGLTGEISEDFARIGEKRSLLEQTVNEVVHHRNGLIGRKNALETIRKRLTKERIGKLTKSELEEILYELRKYYGAIRTRGINQILDNSIRRIRTVLARLLHSNENIESMLESLLNDEHWHLEGAGIGFLTSMLHVRDPHIYPLYNPSVRKGLKRLFPEVPLSLTSGGYLRARGIMLQLKREFNIPSVAIDWVLWRITE